MSARTVATMVTVAGGLLAAGCASGGGGQAALSIGGHTLERPQPTAAIPVGVGSAIEIRTWWTGACTEGSSPPLFVGSYEGADGSSETCTEKWHAAEVRCKRGCTATAHDDAAAMSPSHRFSITPVEPIGGEIELEVALDSGNDRKTIRFPRLRIVEAQLSLVCGARGQPVAPCERTVLRGDAEPYVTLGSDNTPFVADLRINGTPATVTMPIYLRDLVDEPPSADAEAPAAESVAPRPVAPGTYTLVVEVGPPPHTRRTSYVVRVQ